MTFHSLNHPSNYQGIFLLHGMLWKSWYFSRYKLLSDRRFSYKIAKLLGILKTFTLSIHAQYVNLVHLLNFLFMPPGAELRQDFETVSAWRYQHLADRCRKRLLQATMISETLDDSMKQISIEQRHKENIECIW